MTMEPVVVIGAGPAGIAAAHELVRQGLQPLVLEQADRVGGLARTETYKDYYFDIGGHRFFTKIERINALWQEMAGDDFIKVPRLSRIYYRGRYFNYPLRIFNALINLGIGESLLVVLSYLRAQVFPFREEENFEQWVSNRFGRRLYRTFFQTYTEKVWGIPCNSIRTEWAVQRIKGLSLFVAVASALFGNRKTKSLIEEFDYPLRGPGMMWQRFQQAIEEGGGKVCTQSQVTRIRHEDGRIADIAWMAGAGAVTTPLRSLISSMPINRLVTLLHPAAPDRVLDAAHKLSHRAFIIVMLIIDKRELFPDQWIYIHNPDVRVGRIQNFKNWSAAMVPDPGRTSIGMEYFCTEGDELWMMTDGELVALASREIALLSMADHGDVVDSIVVRQPDAYPVYDKDYLTHLGIIKDYIGRFENLQTMGRSGMHRYNNMDHSMHTGILAAENVSGACHDLWAVNDEEEYLEESAAAIPEKVFARTFARMDKIAFASAIGIVAGLFMFLATIWLVVKGGDMVGRNMRLLAQYFTGYRVTVRGAFIAFGYSFFWGFLFGWLYAYIRNLSLAYYLYRSRKKAEMLSLQDFFDHF